MDAAAMRNGHRGDNPLEISAQSEARDAVADLLAADKEYDDAITNLSAVNRSIAECGWIEVEHDALRKASQRLVRARMRRWDALARCGVTP